jgi:hypothetical protein
MMIWLIIIVKEVCSVFFLSYYFLFGYHQTIYLDHVLSSLAYFTDNAQNNEQSDPIGVIDEERAPRIFPSGIAS